MIDVLGPIFIILSYQSYMQAKAELGKIILPEIFNTFSFVYYVIMPSFTSNPFFYSYVLVRFSLLSCRQFLKEIAFYKALIIHYNEKFYADLVVSINSRKVSEMKFTNLHFFPRLSQRDIEKLKEDSIKEEIQLRADIQYIVEVEKTINVLETLENSLLYAMVIFWLGRASLLTFRSV